MTSQQGPIEEDADLQTLLAKERELKEQLLALGGDIGDIEQLLKHVNGGESAFENGLAEDGVPENGGAVNGVSDAGRPSENGVHEAEDDYSRSPSNQLDDTMVNGAAQESETVEDEGSYSDSTESVEDEEEDIDVDALLEQPVAEPQRKPPPKTKRVLQYRGADHFDVLPDGWVEITHRSGLAVYLHKQSRCCTFSRPYFIGPTSVRNHHVPQSSIPCLHQRRILEEMREMAENMCGAERAPPADASISEDASSSCMSQSTDATKASSSDDVQRSDLMSKLNLPVVKLQTSEDMKRSNLTPDQLYEYAKSTFPFKTIQINRFAKWSQTRAQQRKKKEKMAEIDALTEVDASRPGLPRNLKLITVPIMDSAAKPQQRTFYLNPQGKSSVSILHEYVQKVMKSTVKYDFLETNNCANPFHCIAKVKANRNSTSVLSNVSLKEKLQHLQAIHQRNKATTNDAANDENDFCILGESLGASKKQAKILAAKKALDCLVPGLEFNEEGVAITAEKSENGKEPEQSVEIFDLLPIEDSRLPDLCARAGQPMPYLILQECLKRNSAFGDTEITMNSRRLTHQKHEFELHVGRNSVKVVCAHKHAAKQQAAQAMLKKLHPEVETWGVILRLYGNEAQMRQKDARKTRDSVTKLQGKEELDSVQPNTAILEKLRAEMKKLAQKLSDGGEPPLKRTRRIGDSDEPILNEEEAIRASREYAEKHKNGSMHHVRL
ncbi:PASHA protein [Aphelenchoides avenae]|nr:PASHA protein [Aphelenchus avenae]